MPTKKKKAAPRNRIARMKVVEDEQEKFKEEIADEFRSRGILAESNGHARSPDPAWEADVKRQNAVCRRLKEEWDEAKEEAKQAREHYDEAMAELQALIDERDDPQGRLAFGGAGEESHDE